MIRTFLFALSLPLAAAAALPAKAQDPAAIIADFAQCESVSKDKARLKCFEAALERQQTLLAGVSAAPAAIASAAAEESPAQQPEETETPAGTAPAVPREEFGFSEYERERRQLAEVSGEERKSREAEQRKRSTITDRIAKLILRGDGKRLFVLESGQVWIDNADNALPELDEGHEIEIRKSGFGGYRLTRPGRVGRVNVRRLD